MIGKITWRIQFRPWLLVVEELAYIAIIGIAWRTSCLIRPLPTFYSVYRDRCDRVADSVPSVAIYRDHHDLVAKAP